MLKNRIRYLIGLVIVALAGFIIYRGQLEPIQASETVPAPTLTPLPQDWARLTRTAEVPPTAIAAIQLTNTLQPPTLPPTSSPTTAPTATSIPPTNTPTATPTPTATLVPTMPPTLEAEPEAVVAAPRVNPLLVARPTFDDSVNKALLKEQVFSTQVRVRDLVFMMNQVSEGQDLDCGKVGPAYEFIQTQSPSFNVEFALSLANQSYDRGVELALVSLHPLYQACLNAVEGGNYRPIPAQALDSDMFTIAFNQRLKLTAEFNDALLWLNADETKLRALFSSVHSDIDQLSGHLSQGTTDRCDEITELYNKIVQSPRLVVPEGRRLEAYLNYLDAIQFVEQGSASINLHCKEQLARNDGAADAEGAGLPLPPELLAVAQRMLGRSMTAIVAAKDALKAEPMVTGRVLGTQPGEAVNTYDVRLKVTIDAGIPPYIVTLGGFSMGPDNVLTVVHTCYRDFYDNVVVIDSIGQRFESAKISASSAPVCDLP